MSTRLPSRRSVSRNSQADSQHARGHQRRQFLNQLTKRQSPRRLQLEMLEERRVLTYTATLAGSTATVTGDGASDTFLVDTNGGGLLRHNRFGADAGFNSATDWDTAVAGDQTLAVNAASIVNINTGAGADIVTLGTASVAASSLLARFNYSSGGATDVLNVNDSASVVATTYLSSDVTISAPGINVNVVTTVTGGRNLITGTASDAVNVVDTVAGEPQNFNSAGGTDTVTIGADANIGVQDIDGPVNIQNSPFFTILIINNSADTTGRNAVITSTSITGLAPAAITYTTSDIGSLTINAGSGSDTFAVNGSVPSVTNTINAGDGNDIFNIAAASLGAGSVNNLNGQVGNDTFNVTGVTAAGTAINISGGNDNDSVVFGNGATLGTGTFDGGTGIDALDYTAYTTQVAANLGLGTTGLSASLDSTQENPSTTSIAAGTATITNYNAVTKTFDIAVTATDLNPALVTGFHIHRAGVGVNGPIIIDLMPLGPLVPAGTGFTFNAVGVSLATSLLGGVANEASFLGGQTYVNVHTAVNPGGEIRGQIFSNANVALASGTATGTGGVSNVENVTGGTAADSLVGTTAANILNGLAGNDTILGGPGADTFLGGANDDVLIWSNGDGSDIMDGEAGIDTVAVNGNLTADDVFTIGANGTRIDFDRVSPGPFSLDIGTVETLRINGAGGNDTMSVNSLTGVADLTSVNLFGLAGNDTFNINAVTPAGIVTNVSGGAQATADGDLINISAAISVNTIRHFLDSASTGRFEFDGDITDNGGAAESITNYVGLEPINDNANAVNRIFDFGAGNDNDVSILDDGTAGNNIQRIQAPANAELVNFVSPTGSLTVNLGDGTDILSVDAFDVAFPGISINLNGQNDSDEIRLGAAPVGSTVNIDGGVGVPDRVLVGRTAAGTAVSFALYNQSALGTTLAAILAQNVNIHDSGTVGEVYIDDSGDGVSRTFAVSALAAVPVFGGPGIQVNPLHLPGFINVTDDQSIFQLATGTGNDTLNVNATFNNPNGGTVSTFFGNAGDDVFNIQGDGLRGGNIFNGNDGADTFNVNVALGQDITAGSLQINGNATLANRRDQVIITHANARNFNFNYGAGVGELDVTGFTTPVNIDTVETVRLVGSGTDTVTVNGLAGVDEDFTVNPFDTNQILVFRGGNPYDGSTRATHFAQTQLPGVAGGSTSPDLRLSFISQTGFTINGLGGNGAGPTDDRLFAYYSSDQALISTAEQTALTNPFGFGNGILMPSFVSSANAVDDIEVFTGGNLISAVRAGGTALVDVNVAVGSFVQPDVGAVGPRDDNPGVIVNSGHEATPTVADPLCGLRSDQVTVNIAMPFPLSVNGGDPVLNPAAPMQGDRINFNVFVPTINVFSDKQTPPNVTFEFVPFVGTFFDFQESGFECHGPLNAATINLFGDNNTAVGQNDNFVVRGRDVDFAAFGDVDGRNEFTLQINGSPLIPFTGVSFLNVYGDDNPNFATPSTNFVDTLDISQYADNTSLGWGIQTFFNEGLPDQSDGLQVDLIIFHTVLFGGLVSEDIVVQPTGPDAGEIRVTNITDGSMIGVISFVANTDIEFFDDDGTVANGGLLNDAVSDQDTLTLRGANPGTSLLSGNEQFTVNITAALGTPATPVISVTDITTGNILYNIREFRPRAPQPAGSGSDFLALGTTGTVDYTTIKLDPLGGNDTVTVTSSLLAFQTIDLGAGDDTLSYANVAAAIALTAPTIIHGGEGNDTITGSPCVDTIFGGPGNDILVGAGGNDFLFGEEGNDIFGNPTLTADGTANDPGVDNAFGGEGFDNFVWEPGDGADINNGGGDAGDIFRFFGSAAANTFILRPGGTPTHFNALIGAVNIDNHGIEDVIVDGQGGADSFTVDDLFATEVVSINLNLGAADAAAVDPVVINGRNLADNLLLTSSAAGAVSIQGLRYNVNLTNAEATDTLTVNGNEGDDALTAAASLGGVILLRLNGNDGNDFLQGASGNDIFDGGTGDDTFVGGGGTDNVGGGLGSSVGDTILVAGTSGVDTVNLSLTAAGLLVATVNGATTTYANFLAGPIATSGIEQILVQTQNGNDALTVNSTNGALPILTTFDGGANNDSLILTGGTATSDTYSVGPDLNRGTSVIVIGGVTQQVSFLNIEPVIDVVAGPLVVLGTNANNTITYSQGPNAGALVANTGLVSIDGFETIEFGNKTVLTINALAGNDDVTLSNTGAAVPTGLTYIVVSGGLGEDVIDASSSTVSTPLALYGGSGNDTLVGGLGVDLLFGDLGNDTLVDSPGNDAFDGGNNGTVTAGFALPAGVTVPGAVSDPITATGGFDTIVIRGTSGNDVLAATQGTATAVANAGYPLAIVNSAGGAVPAATADVIATVVAGGVPNAVASRPSVEEVRIEAGNGNDEIVVAHADEYVAATGTGLAPVLNAGSVPQQMVRFDVRGDSPNASDRLTVQDLGAGDLVLLRQAVDQRTGRVTIAPAVNTTTVGGFLGDVVYTGIEKVNITPINPLNGGTGTNGLGQVVVFDTDPFEYNDNILSAEDIAHIELVTRTPNIDPANNAALPVVTPAGNGDEDWYAFTPTQNGTFTINTLFSAIPVAQPTIPGTRPGLPGNGLLASGLYAAIGAATAPLVVGSPLLSPTGAAIGTQLQFAGLQGVTYYLRIVGAGPIAAATPGGLPAVGTVSASASVNTYDISLAQIDNLGPQVFDPDGSIFPAQAIQIVDAPLYNLFDNKQTFNSTVAAAPAPGIAAGVVNFTPVLNLVGMQIGESVTFTSGPNAGLTDTITGINGNTLRFGGPGSPSVFVAPVAGNAFFVGAPTPTPNVNGLTINFRDPISGTQTGVGPGATLGALDAATALNPGNYVLRGDATGIIPIQNVRFAVPATGIIGGAVLVPNAAALNTLLSLNAGVGLSIANGPIVGQTLQFTSGPNVGLSGRITGYNSVTGSLRFASPFPVAPATGNTFIISPSPIVISPTPVLGTAVVTAASTNVVINLGAGAVTGAGLSTVAGTYVGQALQITSGALAGETRTITAYNGAGVFTVSGAVVANGFSAAPAIGDVFNIVGTPATAVGTAVGGAASSANSIAAAGAGLSLVPGFYVGQALQFTSGALSGQSRVITGYTTALGSVFSFGNGFTGTPAAGDAFVIVPQSPAALANAVVGAPAPAANNFVGGLGNVAGVGLSPVSGAYAGQILQFTSGALLGQAQVITDYFINGAANATFTFTHPFSAAPAAADTFNILPVNVAAITLDFEGPLPDDRYTLTVSDEIRDYVGNQLDGNMGAAQPTGSPTFPSGDGISGGDFVARFNVDSRPEQGTWAAGSSWIDINGNQIFDPTNVDFTNRDIGYLFGYTSDEIFAGNFAATGAAAADGFDKLAAYGRVGGQWRWQIDTDNDGVPNIEVVDPAAINGFPVSGNFGPNAGDEVGLFTGSTWHLDVDHDFNLNDGAGVRVLPWTNAGVPVIGYGFTGDFDGDGAYDLGTWTDDTFRLSLSSLSGGLVDGAIDATFFFGFAGARERPVAADMNSDGIDDIGLWTPDRATQVDGQAGEWYWLISGQVNNDTPAPGGGAPTPAVLGPTIPQRIVPDPITPGRNLVKFTPVPFGNDLYMQFGDEFSLPIVGNFDPPVTAAVTPTFSNIRDPLDVNNDGEITAFDALGIINELNLHGGPFAPPTGEFLHAPFLDVDGNGQVTAFDALNVINYLNLHPVSKNSGGEETDSYFASLVDDKPSGDADDDLLGLLAGDGRG